MSHVVVSCKCHIDVYNKTVRDQAWHTHTTVFTRKIHEVFKKQQQQLNTLR